jgi:MarR family transcriptional regulator, organic hydroperoxide resistance regulator
MRAKQQTPPQKFEHFHVRNPTALSEQTPGYILRAAYLAMIQTLQRRLSAYHLTSPQWWFLREIWNEEGLTQRELSARVGTAESTTVSALRVLQRRKLITRVVRKGDRRAVGIFLTAAGRRLEQDVMPIIEGVNEVGLRGFSKEQLAGFVGSLIAFQDNLKIEESAGIEGSDSPVE